MSNAAAAPAPIPPPPVQPYDELLKHLGLSREDLRRLQHEDLTVMELMTEQLRPIAQRKELERRKDITETWQHHQRETQEATQNGTEPPTWYYGDEDPLRQFTELEALDNLAGEINWGVYAHHELSTSKAYDLGIKDELPEWMTWNLLETWANLIRCEAQMSRREATPPPPPFDE